MNEITIQPFFITCSVSHIIYMRGSKVENNPVNLSLCTNISKGKYAWYPDNTGKPSIKFHGCDTEWVYDYEKDRDIDFSWISQNRFKTE